jgi:hypothetical protein
MKFLIFFVALVPLALSSPFRESMANGLSISALSESVEHRTQIFLYSYFLLIIFP